MAAALRDVAAGIECLEAYRRVVVVRAARVVGSAGSSTGRGGLDSGHKQAKLVLLQDHEDDEDDDDDDGSAKIAPTPATQES